MALTLTVERERWRQHLAAVRTGYPGLVPVVKGNGYGFGRAYLAEIVAGWAREQDGPRELAVGTVHELAGLPVEGPRPIVLTPATAHELVPGVGPAILTVGRAHHVADLAATRLRPPVIVKLASPMHRYGVEPDDLSSLLAAAAAADLAVHGYAIHPPLAETGAPNLEAVLRWVPHLPEGSTVYVSHLDAEAYAALVSAAPDLRWRIRLGTALWHGDKSCLRLSADVADVQPVHSGERVGYRQVEVAGDGHLVMVTAGSAHGVQPLPADGDGPTRSPFHFARRRLDLVEPPHMHTAMLFVPAGGPVPAVGDQIDVQHPLTRTLVDRIVER